MTAQRDAVNQPGLCSNLYPLLCIEAASEPNAWKLLIFDKVARNNSSSTLMGNEALQYIDIWSGQRNLTAKQNPTLNDMPQYMYRTIDK